MKAKYTIKELEELLIGKTFGRLTVSGYAGVINRRRKWDAFCDCGNVVKRHESTFFKAKAPSCGCAAIELLDRFKHKHGLHKSREYRIYHGMKQRCSNPKAPEYKNYGGRGIKVCERWLKSFENFRADMGEAPASYSIERVDFNGNYEPSNCKWASALEQSNNTRRNRYIEINGTRATLSQHVKSRGLNKGTVAWRLRQGMTPEQALSTVKYTAETMPKLK